MSTNSAGTPVQGNINKEHSVLLQCPSYMAHKAYLGSTVWDTANEHRTKTLFTSDGLSPLFSIITGKVSRSNFHLSTIGDCKLVGEPRQLPFSILDARIRFSLEEPLGSSNAAFGQDFKKIVAVTLDAVDSMPGDDEKGRVSPFLTQTEDGQWRFNFEFKIFDKKYIHSVNSQVPEPLDLDTYAIPQAYQPFIEKLKYAYCARRLPVWDCTGDAVEPEDYASFMRDALVKLHIKLTHDKQAGLNAEVTYISIIG